jgi:hypothetical protein
LGNDFSDSTYPEADLTQGMSQSKINELQDQNELTAILYDLQDLSLIEKENNITKRTGEL